jgi:serine/threonine protein kinase
MVLPAILAMASLRSSPDLTIGAAPHPQKTPVTCQLGDFQLLRELGRGGMGIVYEAEQISLGRRVALKTLPFAGVLDSRQLQRFRNEARAAATLDHPHIVHVYAVGQDRGIHFYAMQLIAGQSLADYIAQRRAGNAPENPLALGGSPLPADIARQPTVRLSKNSTVEADCSKSGFQQVARWGVQAAEALEQAHQMGIVHRDVKPSNLLVNAEGKLWVTDFGLAMTQADTGLTVTGDVLGTFRYMSPEQVLGRRHAIDHRTDVYSLGVTLYELLALQPAFPSADRAALIKQLEQDDPPPLRQVTNSIPAELETIVSKAMQKEPGARYATAQALADDLQRYLDDRPIVARRPSVWETSANGDGGTRRWFAAWPSQRPSPSFPSSSRRLSRSTPGTRRSWNGSSDRRSTLRPRSGAKTCSCRNTSARSTAPSAPSGRAT